MSRLPQIGDLIDNRFEITGLCSSDGGMGVVYFVKDQDDNHSRDDVQLVLKYCKAEDEASIKRFKREVRLLSDFRGNQKVTQLAHLNTDHEPPFYVMQFYEDGDLTTLIPILEDSKEFQEQLFLQMCDCISELHAVNVFHRDIKPQNFLRFGESIAVSDLGLSIERDSLTAFTNTSEAWGTQGYTPPEYAKGGFKNADARFDMFMLGKSFYVLLTKRDPLYLLPDDVHPAIFSVIERCCAIDPDSRYGEIHQVKQAIVAAYDVILNRVEGDIECRQQLERIMERLKKEGKIRGEDVNEFLDGLCRLEFNEQESICQDIEPRFFHVVSQQPFSSRQEKFIAAYDRMVRNSIYGWSFAETVADCASYMLAGDKVAPKVKAAALDMAIHAAVYQNRFAAMDTCRNMITGVRSDSDAIAIRGVIQKYGSTFVRGIEAVSCENHIIAAAIRALGKASKD